MKPDTKKHYLIWNTDGDVGYWCINDSIEDALSNASEKNGDGSVTIFEMSPKLLGNYKLTPKAVKTKVKNK